MPLLKELEQFGLDNKKAKVYLAVLELGEAKAFSIAKKAGLERPTTYDILEKLIKERWINFYEKRGVRYYLAENPETVQRQLASKEQAFAGLLPQLKSLHNTLEFKPRIRFYEGVDGVKTVFDDTLTVKNKKLCGILSMVDLFKMPGREFMKNYVENRIKSGIGLRVIRSRPKEAAEDWPTDTAAKRELRYAPADMIFSMTMYIYDDKVGLISSQKENFGMLIESEELRDNMQNLFEALWQISAPDKQK